MWLLSIAMGRHIIFLVLVLVCWHNSMVISNHRDTKTEEQNIHMCIYIYMYSERGRDIHLYVYMCVCLCRVRIVVEYVQECRPTGWRYDLVYVCLYIYLALFFRREHLFGPSSPGIRCVCGCPSRPPSSSGNSGIFEGFPGRNHVDRIECHYCHYYRGPAAL